MYFFRCIFLGAFFVGAFFVGAFLHRCVFLQNDRGTAAVVFLNKKNDSFKPNYIKKDLSKLSKKEHFRHTILASFSTYA